MNNTDDNKNMIYFLIASMILLAVYQFFILGPQQKKHMAAEQAAAASSSLSASAIAAGLPVAGQATALTRAQALAQSPRVQIDTPSLKGSIALKGALIDDLYLAKYHDTVDPKSPMVELLSPAGAPHAYYVQSGFNGQNLSGMPDANTLWTVASGQVLSVGHPVVLTYDNGAGLTFTRTLSIDANYMITEQDQVTNRAATPATLAAYALVMRHDVEFNGPGHSPYVHEGTIATYSKTNGTKTSYVTRSFKYKALAKPNNDKFLAKEPSVGGWFAITDKYWMAAVIPAQNQAVSFTTKADIIDGKPVYTAGYVDAPVTIAPGKSWTTTSQVFAGAKLNKELLAYQKNLHIPRFDFAIDWGTLFIITYPVYWLLEKFYLLTGNFGIAILLLTVVVKLVFYPLAHRSYVSMMKMKHVQQHLKPKLDAIKQRFPDDAQKQQEATMQLYQEEKVNPMAGLTGCLPMLLQLPVFWSLYKVLQLAIDMRHAPFFGWIHDLSAPDTTSIVNLFGLLPFDPAHVPLIGTFLAGPLHVGIIAIIYGASMWLSQQMTPMAGVDPMQKKMMAFMPLMLTFFMAQVAVGLIIYWIWSNILTMLQQYTIMRRLGVENIIDDTLAKLTKKKAA
ncbi:membrane protein insertase YidC [Asticcacaulis sp. EMRT-3]|uniref:membrane protein insertase YidC n=1 Tax=Asticcacaulis sp. EMRT-3 TaxID=3040349 RepID=UPI0024AEA7B4|nr:membrane protein insertase YidC [Asticcacaulis sp. EMRT-3]MDI7773864.1 membrane protein insertase YidC [Asticcacaulis sp. EMRT-3]